MILSLKLEDELKKLNSTLCYQCGTCTGTCPVARVEERFNPRRIIDKIKLYGIDSVLNNEEIWYCVECFICMEKCPQNVKITEIFFKLYEEVIKRGIKKPRKYVGLVKAIYSTGVSTGAYGGKPEAFSGLILKKREKMGLPKPVVKEEVAKTIIESTGLNKILED